MHPQTHERRNRCGPCGVATDTPMGHAGCGDVTPFGRSRQRLRECGGRVPRGTSRAWFTGYGRRGPRRHDTCMSQTHEGRIGSACAASRRRTRQRSRARRNGAAFRGRRRLPVGWLSATQSRRSFASAELPTRPRGRAATAGVWPHGSKQGRFERGRPPACACRRRVALGGRVSAAPAPRTHRRRRRRRVRAEVRPTTEQCSARCSTATLGGTRFSSCSKGDG